jgi:hypothetical protein
MLRIIIQIIFHSFFSVPPALFHDGKYMKENPNADVSREGTITPRQILIESKRSISVKSHSSY